MLLVLFEMGGSRYAIGSDAVVEIVPLVPLTAIPRAPEYVLGLLQYRGAVVPVLDAGLLAGKRPIRPLMSSRIILARYRNARGTTRVLGLAAEAVTSTLRADARDVCPSGIAVTDAPYLGDIVPSEQGFIQVIEVSQLLPEPVQQLLFTEPAG